MCSSDLYPPFLPTQYCAFGERSAATCGTSGCARPRDLGFSNSHREIATLIKNKRGQIFNLNSSGNVYAEFDGNDNLTVLAKNTSGDMNIEEKKWEDMAKKFGYGHYGWKESNVKNIKFNTNGIYLPKNSAYFFKGLKGEIIGCEKLNTSKVERMCRQ